MNFPVLCRGLNCFWARKHYSCSLITCLNTWWRLFLDLKSDISTFNREVQSVLMAAARWHNAGRLLQVHALKHCIWLRTSSLKMVGYNKTVSQVLEWSLVSRLSSFCHSMLQVGCFYSIMLPLAVTRSKIIMQVMSHLSVFQLPPEVKSDNKLQETHTIKYSNRWWDCM